MCNKILLYAILKLYFKSIFAVLSFNIFSNKISMVKFLRNLKTKQKLTLQGLFGVGGLIVSFVVFFWMSKELQSRQKKLENYANIKSDVISIRTSYNILRGDILTFFILDPVEDKELLAQTQSHYNKYLNDIIQTQNVLEKTVNQDENLHKSTQDLLVEGGKLLDFCQKNSTKIIELRHGQDSSYITIKTQIIQDFRLLFERLSDRQEILFAQIEMRRQEANNDLAKIEQDGIFFIISIIIVTALIVFGLSHYIGEQIAGSVIKVKDILEKIAIGQLPKVELDSSKNEIAEMTNSLHTLVTELDNLRQFTNEVGSGNFDKEVAIFQNQGEIAGSLSDMKINLKKASEIEKIQNWTTSGLAEIGKILRKDYDYSSDLYSEVLSYLVRYLKANQGSFFIADEQNNNTQLELIACWAYNRKKFVQKTLNVGEGLVGQVYLEREAIYMTKIPDNYIKITSGLGEATPKNLLIFPLINNDKVQGIIEIASFNTIEDYQRDFLKQFADVMAAEIIAEKVNTRTTKLLKQSQEQAEEMRAQEEELRQNMEEMQATQEEVQRKSKEIEKILAESNSILAGINMTMITAEFTVEGDFMATNSHFDALMKFPPSSILGKHHTVIVPPERKNTEAYEKAWATMRSGKSIMGVYQYKSAIGELVWFNAVYSPVFDENDNVLKIMLFATDMTAQKAKEAEVEILLSASVAQEEQLRQSMEELSANQESIQAKERFLHELINSSSDSIMVVDANYKLLNFNNTLKNSYTGITVSEGTDIFDLLPTDQHDAYKVTYDRSLKKGEKFSETTHYQMDGINAYFFAQYTPLYDQNGEIMGVSVFAKDITEMMLAKQNAENIAAQFEAQNQALEEQKAQLHLSMEELSANQENIESLFKDLEEKESYLHELLNASTDSIMVIDQNYNLKTFNNSLAQAYQGIEIKEGKSVLDLLPAAEHEAYKATYNRVLKGGETFAETTHLQMEGIDAYFTARYAPIRNADNEIIAVAIIAKDVSELEHCKQKQNELQKSLNLVNTK